MTNQFDPTAWRQGAQLTDTTREAWETQSFAAAQSKPVSGDAGIPLDATLATATADLSQKWYNLIGNVGVRMGSDASKMKATGDNYASSEEQAVKANERFWDNP